MNSLETRLKYLEQELLKLKIFTGYIEVVVPEGICLLKDVLEKLIKKCAEVNKVSVEEFLKSRKKPLIYWRQAIIYLANIEMGMTTKPIGEIVGKIDHSLVLYIVQKFRDYIKTQDMEPLTILKNVTLMLKIK